MQLFKKINLLTFPMVFFPMLGFATNAENLLIWKATYYNSIPNQQNVSQKYCNQHEPGTFIGTVQDELKKDTTTNHQIKLSHFTFHQKIQNGIYLMKGTLIANGKTNNENWQDSIHYYVYKLTPNGMTQGVWSSTQCKGLYLGTVIKQYQTNVVS